MERRSVLQAAGLGMLGLAIGGPARAAPRSASRLLVEDVEVFDLPINRRGHWLIVRLRTTGGLTGLGDASHGGQDDVTVRHVKRLVDLLRGQPILEVERFRQAASAALGPNPSPQACAAASALEQCLWDLIGKALDVPASDLFGGRLRDRIRLYANINRSTDPRTPAGFAAMAEAAIAAGFDAVKLAPFDGMPTGGTDRAAIERFTRDGLSCAQAVRRAIGPMRDLLIDAHSHFDRADGLALAERLRPLDLFWLEEVTPADPLADLAAINQAAPMPTAGGESIHGVAGFYRYIAADAVDIVMPDVKICGGMTELRKIAALAEGAGKLVSPHGPASPIGTIAAAQVIAGVPNFNILEFAFGEVPWRAELLDPPEQVDHGKLVLADAPGFGVTLNARTIARYASPL